MGFFPDLVTVFFDLEDEGISERMGALRRDGGGVAQSVQPSPGSAAQNHPLPGKGEGARDSVFMRTVRWDRDDRLRGGSRVGCARG